jgi:hypothetical protein
MFGHASQERRKGYLSVAAYAVENIDENAMTNLYTFKL